MRRDPPPSYSIVTGLTPSSVTTSPSTTANKENNPTVGLPLPDNHTTTAVSGGSQGCQNHSSIGDSNRQPSFTKPPEYEQALEFLAQSGIMFNRESLTPMPPAYDSGTASGGDQEVKSSEGAAGDAVVTFP